MMGTKLFPGKSVMVLVLIGLLVVSMHVQGADSLYRMLHGDNPSFAGDQDAIVLFEVLDLGDYAIKAKVHHVVIGEIVGETISISRENIRLLGMLPDPDLKQGDYCVMSVKRYGDVYKQVYAALKADSGDYKSLKFYYSSYFSDIDVLQYFVNSGGVVKDYSFDGGQVFAKLADGSKKEITLPREGYLPEDQSQLVTEVVEERKAIEDLVSSESPESEAVEASGIDSFRAIIIGMAVLVGVIGYGLGHRVRSRKSSPK